MVLIFEAANLLKNEQIFAVVHKKEYNCLDSRFTSGLRLVPSEQVEISGYKN